MIMCSVITCPECELSKEEEMPTDACQYFYDCTNCGVLLKPKKGDCCVFCSYGTIPCPPIQKEKRVVMDKIRKPRQWGWLILFTSSATLVCCVLPIVLVSLGMGAIVASLYGNLPFLTFLGIHKLWTFGITAFILAMAACALYRPNRTCPADPELAKACTSAHKWNSHLFWISILLWGISFFAAYLLLPVTRWLGL